MPSWLQSPSTTSRPLARKLYDMAMGGNLKAAKLLLDHLLGKPAEAPSPDDGMKQQYPILVTTTAEATKRLEEKRRLNPNLDNDPHRGRKPLTDRNAGE